MHSSRIRIARFSCHLGGLGLPGGCLPRGCTPPPPMNRMTDRCKNITLPKLRLRVVKIKSNDLQKAFPGLHEKVASFESISSYYFPFHFMATNSPSGANSGFPVWVLTTTYYYYLKKHKKQKRKTIRNCEKFGL